MFRCNLFLHNRDRLQLELLLMFFMVLIKYLHLRNRLFYLITVAQRCNIGQITGSVTRALLICGSDLQIESTTLM